MYCSEGVAVLISHEDSMELKFYSISWPEGVAILIPNENKLKLRSYSIHWPEKVTVLISFFLISLGLGYYVHQCIAQRGWQF